MAKGGFGFDANGKLLAINAVVTPPAAADPYLVAWRLKTSDGSIYVEDLVAGAVPAGSPINAGVATKHSDGRVYVTTAAPGATSRALQGIMVRDDGAMHVDTAAVAATDSFNGGWRITAAGAARMTIT